MGWQSKSREENNPKVENKLQKVGAFFAAEKVVRKRPQTTTN
jgi:hypothetical protein